MPPRSVRYEARIENLAGILEFVTECAGEIPWAARRLPDMELVVEEAVVKVCRYAYPQGGGEVEVRCDGDDTAFSVLISDEGTPFNVLEAKEPDLSADILEREVGGLGCFLIRSMSDRAEYRREEGRNLLKLMFLPGGKGGGGSGAP
ncbi:MAG: ATP-binding protein [Geobacteraceae bacterium]|nr:ATP-binding protein [Geobacteraceae bacterium]